jgi:DNA processing protein
MIVSPDLQESRLAWLALKLTDGLGPRRIWRAVETFGSATAVLRMPMTALESNGFPTHAAQEVSSGSALARAETELKICEEMGAAILTPQDANYPKRLAEIYDPPVALWTRGDTLLLPNPGIAVVGTRHPTPYGAGMAEMLSRDLAAKGLVILSGMARGIDTSAHNGALQAKGKTVAVWGTGIDVIYPKENKGLAERIIAEGGAIISEFPTGTYPSPSNFPVRNRILSGISAGVLVVEAGENSGTRITARCALEQNRDVFAVPGNVTNKQSWGPNTLIKQGARLVATWEDVWEDLPMDIRLAVEELNAAKSGVESEWSPQASIVQAQSMSEQESAVFALLRKDEAMQLDEMIEALEMRLSSSEIFAALFELELQGRVRQMPGKNYLKAF